MTDTMELIQMLTARLRDKDVKNLPVFIQFGYQKLGIERIYCNGREVCIIPAGGNTHGVDE